MHGLKKDERTLAKWTPSFTSGKLSNHSHLIYGSDPTHFPPLGSQAQRLALASMSNLFNFWRGWDRWLIDFIYLLFL